MMDEPICDTPVTQRQVCAHLKDHFGSNAKFESLEADIIGAGDGMVSNILRVTPNWTNPEGLPESVVVKAPTSQHAENLSKDGDGKPDDTETDKQDLFADMVAQWVPAAHNVECRVYEMFGDDAPIPVPECYASVEMDGENDGMLVMEDMSHKAGISPSFLDGMTYEQVLAAVDSIPCLQTWGFTTDIDWRSKVHSLEDFAGFMKTYLNNLSSMITDMKTKYPEVLDSVDLARTEEIANFDNAVAIWSEHRTVMDDVFAHWDYHKNNIMFEKNDDGSVSDRLAVVIDFQGAMRGSPVADLGRLMAFSTTQEFRDKYELEILHRYYDAIKLSLGERFKASFEQMRRWYYRYFCVEAILMVAWIPALMVFAVKSEGDQRKEDEMKFLNNVKDAYHHGVRMYDEVSN